MSARGFMTSTTRTSWEGPRQGDQFAAGLGQRARQVVGRHFGGAPERSRCGRTEPGAGAVALSTRRFGVVHALLTVQVGVRHAQTRQHRTLEAFHGLGLIIADVIVSEKVQNAVHR
jgi:hypothetical protein